MQTDNVRISRTHPLISPAVLEEELPDYTHVSIDIRDGDAIDRLFREYNADITVVIHAAAQPSHDWASREPKTDFDVNAAGTLNLLEASRAHCPAASFIFTSTNKVYGDAPNRLPLIERETRYELEPGHRFAEDGIDESMSIDGALHSLFGASKVAADIYVQEYGRYFGMNTACFRGGCLTGPAHAGAKLHGFLAYLARCAVTGRPYQILGYGGKQVRDNLHAGDLAEMFWHYCQAPRPGAVYNAGGGRHSNCSILEAIAIFEELTGKSMNVTCVDEPRVGDHIWWIRDGRRFRTHYPEGDYQYDLQQICADLVDTQVQRTVLV